MASPPPALLLIAGPTASGKTELAIELAQHFGAEILSADSRQVYRGLDIGTAKASLEQRQRVPHHGLDLVDPGQPFDVARYVELADQSIAGILQRGRRVVVVGGTGLYLRVLCRGLLPAAPRDEALRAQLRQEAQQHGPQVLHRRLAAMDPVSAERLPANDVVRVIRAIEVTSLSGVPLSEQQQQHGFAQQRYRALWLVHDQPPETLEQRIADRARQMFAQGLVEEATALRARHGKIALLDTMGYREALALADGTLAREEAIEQTRLRTRRYAKRQRTWFRREPVHRWMLAARVAEAIEWVEAQDLFAPQ